MVEKNQRWVSADNVCEQNVADGVIRKILAHCEDIMCVENIFTEGAVGALHSHPHTQITYVLEGEFEFTIEGETKIVKKGDTLLKQNGVEHGCVCTKAGKLLDIFNPIRKDFL